MSQNQLIKMLNEWSAPIDSLRRFKGWAWACPCGWQIYDDEIVTPTLITLRMGFSLPYHGLDRSDFSD